MEGITAFVIKGVRFPLGKELADCQKLKELSQARIEQVQVLPPDPHSDALHGFFTLDGERVDGHVVFARKDAIAAIAKPLEAHEQRIEEERQLCRAIRRELAISTPERDVQSGQGRFVG